jgi:DNA-binding transcriptional LysR family regulator
MASPALPDLANYLAVARERSFTRAAAQLGMTPSALSHAIRGLEERMGVRLLTRTTRSVALTQAGEQLMHGVAPRIDEIYAELDALQKMRDRPAGMVRITTGADAAEAILWPRVSAILRNYPDIQVEISVDTGLTDIVKDRFDAGIRMGEQIARDMVAVKIGPELRMAAVAAPGYFKSRPVPKIPQDLAQHACINLRFPTRGNLYAWEFQKGRRSLNVRVDGPVIVNDIALARRAALDDAGIAYLPEDYVQPLIRAGKLARILSDWCPPFPGYHLYYPSRRQVTPGLGILIEALRYRG